MADVHISTPLTITKAWVEAHRGVGHLRDGMPRCSVCDGPLRIGSIVDHYWPYYSTNNFHKCCKYANERERLARRLGAARRDVWSAIEYVDEQALRLFKSWVLPAVARYNDLLAEIDEWQVRVGVEQALPTWCELHVDEPCHLTPEFHVDESDVRGAR